MIRWTFDSPTNKETCPQITVMTARNLGSLILSKVHDSGFEIIFRLRYFHKRNSSCLLYSFTVIVTSSYCTYWSKKGGLWSKIRTSIADLVIMRVPSLPCVTTEKKSLFDLKEIFLTTHTQNELYNTSLGPKIYTQRDYWISFSW